jgi:hypothetical protein
MGDISLNFRILVWPDPITTHNKPHVDKNLVTAPAWPAHPVWLAKFLEVLGTRIEL